jgi:hypothetical protein
VIEISKAPTITIEDFERDQVAQAIFSHCQAKLVTEALQHSSQGVNRLRAKLVVLKQLVHHAPITTTPLCGSGMEVSEAYILTECSTEGGLHAHWLSGTVKRLEG